VNLVATLVEASGLLSPTRVARRIIQSDSFIYGVGLQARAAQEPDGPRAHLTATRPEFGEHDPLDDEIVAGERELALVASVDGLGFAHRHTSGIESSGL
jgi:hypothetical protein